MNFLVCGDCQWQIEKHSVLSGTAGRWEIAESDSADNAIAVFASTSSQECTLIAGPSTDVLVNGVQVRAGLALVRDGDRIEFPGIVQLTLQQKASYGVWNGAHSRCPVCRVPFDERETVAYCVKGHAHHAKCYQAREYKCGVFGCGSVSVPAGEVQVDA